MRTAMLLTISLCTTAITTAAGAELDIDKSGAISALRRIDSNGLGESIAVGAGVMTSSAHTNNWAVLVCTSRFWFNYRHIANTLSMYRTVKRLGIPDSNIILMLADDVACNSRNHFPATVYNNAERKLDLYGDNIEVDYRGYEVTVESFIRVLTGMMFEKNVISDNICNDPLLKSPKLWQITGRHEDHVPRSKRLLTDDRSNILIFMTGHGGKEFLKFQDAEEMGSHDIGDAIAQMFEKKRYNEIFFMMDTCQAASMYKHVYSPNVIAATSSLVGENSYSHHHDMEIGTAVIDRWTYSNLETLEKLERQDKSTLGGLFSTYDPNVILSNPGIRTDLFPRGVNNALVTDFFGAVQNIELTIQGYPKKKVPLTGLRVRPDAKFNFVPSSHAATIEKTVNNPRNQITNNLQTVSTEFYFVNLPFSVAFFVFLTSVWVLGQK
ncbi:hypothetical protein HK100_003553 [Physocladia obscura]|uniref:GPI-anchor transamidase n=1 Tax=Physocladia obscura TaxID=109957 RepID=A0AAD5TAH3_9FUNG|nr:hypothetical protein HK100_003553 [Physocladia obscura]